MRHLRIHAFISTFTHLKFLLISSTPTPKSFLDSDSDVDVEVAVERRIKLYKAIQ